MRKIAANVLLCMTAEAHPQVICYSQQAAVWGEASQTAAESAGEARASHAAA